MCCCSSKATNKVQIKHLAVGLWSIIPLVAWPLAVKGTVGNFTCCKAFVPQRPSRTDSQSNTAMSYCNVAVDYTYGCLGSND